MFQSTTNRLIDKYRPRNSWNNWSRDISSDLTDVLNWDVSDEGFIPCLPDYRRFTSNLTLYIALLWDLRIAWLFCFCVNDEFRYGQRLIYSRCAYSYLTRCADNGCIVITQGPLWLNKARDTFRWFRWRWSGCVYVQLSKMPWYVQEQVQQIISLLLLTVLRLFTEASPGCCGFIFSMLKVMSAENDELARQDLNAS